MERFVYLGCCIVADLGLMLANSSEMVTHKRANPLPKQATNNHEVYKVSTSCTIRRIRQIMDTNNNRQINIMRHAPLDV